MVRDGVILVVDDDADTREAMIDLLVDAGLHAVGAANGAHALQLLAGLSPSAMLVDLEMPKVDGEQFFAACDANPRWAGVPRVLVSGSREAPAAARRCSAILLTKPVDPDRLLRALQQASVPARTSA